MARVATDADELRKIMVAFVVEQTGYPEDIVELDADLEADLGIDSIKKAQLFGELGERLHIAPRDDLSLDAFPTLRHVLNFLVEELGSRRGAGEVLRAAAAAAVAGSRRGDGAAARRGDAAADANELRKIMVAFVVEQTGYPEDIVELDADLEADLGIDSIKKAQLFGELGERLQIAPRDDLSLDAFPTLRHVLNFLVEELGSRAAGEDLALPASPAIAEETAEAVTAAAPQWPQPLGALRIEVLEGTPREMGLQHGRALAAEIHREIAGLVDATDARISRNGELWQGATLEELHGLADGAAINVEGVESWNFVLEPLAAWRTAFGTGGGDPGALSSNSTTVVQVRRPAGGLPYLLVAKAGQVLPRAGVNAAGVAISWEPLEADPSPSDVVALAEVIHGALDASQAHQEAQTRLRNVAVRGRWCIGVSRSEEPIETYFHLDERGIAASPPEDASPQQREFHRQMREKPATLVIRDRQTGSSKTIVLSDFLRPAIGHRVSQQQSASAFRKGTVPFSSDENRDSPQVIEESRMRRHVLRMVAAPLAADGESVYRPGELVCAIGPAVLAGSLRGAWEKFGCRTLLLTEGDWSARWRELLAGEVPRHLLLLQEAAAPPAEFDRFHAADHFVEIVEATRQWIEALERRVGVGGASLTASTRMGGDFGFHSLNGGFSGGGMTGLLKAIRREFAALTAKVLDFDGECPPDEMSRCLVEEMAGIATELEVGFRRGRRYVVQAVAQPVRPALREIPRVGLGGDGGRARRHRRRRPGAWPAIRRATPPARHGAGAAGGCALAWPERR